MIRTILLFSLTGLVFLCGSGCGGGANTSDPDRVPLEGSERSRREESRPQARTSTQAPEGPALIVAGEAIPYSALRPFLAEAGGGAAMEDLVLEKLVSAEAARSGIEVSENDIQAERVALAETLARVAGVTPDQSERLIEELRRSRALGPTRFASLLRRQATLRKLAAPRVQVSPAQIEQGLAVRFGPRVRLRLIVTNSERDAGAIMSRLREVERAGGDVRSAFVEEAVRNSVDASAPRGGLIEPISAADATYPVSFRSMIGGATPGSLQGVVALDRGFAIAYIEELLPGEQSPAPAERARLEQDLRFQAEREEMQRIADSLLREATVTVFDRDLRWAWDQRTR